MVSLILPEKRMKKFNLSTMIPHLSDLIDFVRFLEELKTPKRHFEINCPLADPVRNPHLVLGTVRHVAISAKKKA